MLAALGTVCLLSLALAVFLATRAFLENPGNPVWRAFRSYLSSLDARLIQLQAPRIGSRIAAGQGALLAALLVGVALTGPSVLYLIAVCAVAGAPVYVLRQKTQARTLHIEANLSSFCVSLANSLRVAPSIGKALVRTHEGATGPMAEELAVALRDMQLGATVEQALVNMSSRNRSAPLDSVLGSILIGRQIGGRLPEILDTTGETIRETERLRGVIRAKTSEGKGQILVMAAAPPFIFFAFDLLRPGYFEPLTTTFVGWMLFGASIVFWGLSVVTARRILALDV